ncbi:MAG: leucine-rich repeat protein [Firmicutes bacterium]|nr:leucine-rich repeat protein [Bacillota bacterium]
MYKRIVSFSLLLVILFNYICLANDIFQVKALEFQKDYYIDDKIEMASSVIVNEDENSSDFNDSVFSIGDLQLYDESNLYAYPVEGGNIYFDQSSGAIVDCDESVISVDIPSEINGIEVTIIDEDAFSNCHHLSNVRLSNSITEIGNNAFFADSHLENITFSDNLKKIGKGSFKYCNLKLNNLIFPDTLTEIGDYAFNGCDIYNIVFSKNLKYIGDHAFDNSVENIQKISIPDKVKSIGVHAFSNCYNCKVIELPADLETIGACAFFNCENLSSLSLPTNATRIEERAFYGCKNLKELFVPNNINSIGFQAFGWWGGSILTITKEYNAKLSWGSINGAKPRKIRFIDEIPKSWANCYSLEEVEFIGNVQSIPSFSFCDCKNLSTILFTDNLQSIGNSAFKNTNLKSIIFPNNLKEISPDAFADCKCLEKIKFSSNVEIGIRCFSGCENIKKISLYNNQLNYFNNSIYLGWRDFKNINEINFQGDNINIPEYCFANTDIMCLEIDSSIDSIDRGAFCDCPNLKKVEYVSNNNQLIDISESTFSNCTNLIEVKIGDNIKNINEKAFFNDSLLTQIFIPSSVEYIAGDAFEGCTNLIIYAPKGSYAEDYAIKHGFTQAPSDNSEMGENNSKFEMPKLKWFEPNTTSEMCGITAKYYTPTKSIDDITWTSSNTDVVEIISNSGIDGIENTSVWCQVKCKDLGEATITVSNSNGASASCKVQVVDEINLITENTNYGLTSGDYEIDKKYLEKYLNNAINEYNVAVKKYEEAVVDELNTTQVSKASEERSYQALKPQLRAMLTGADYNVTEEEAACRALYYTLRDMNNTSIALEKIDLSNPNKREFNISKSIINAVVNAYRYQNKTYSYKNYSCTVNIMGFDGAEFGSIVVKNKSTNIPKTIAVTSTKEEAAAAMSSYCNQLKALEENSLKEALFSSIDFFDSALGIDKYIYGSVLKKIDKYFPELNNLGLVELVSFVGDVKASANEVKSILAVDDWNYESAYNEISKISKLDLHDAQKVSATTAQKAYANYQNCRNILISTAINYISGVEKPSLWDTLKQMGQSFITTFKCPVNVTVFDENGNEIGFVSDYEISVYSDDIYIERNGDTKIVYSKIPLTYKIDAYDYGQLNITQEYYNDGEVLGRQNFYDIVLKDEQELKTNTVTTEPQMMTVTTEDKEILPNEYIPYNDTAVVNIDYSNVEGGTIIGVKKCVRGDYVTLTAIPEEDYCFNGWYSDEELISTDLVYSFTATKDIEITPRFTNVKSTNIIKGDLNGDESIDSKDAVIILNYSSGSIELSDDAILAGDVNDDEVIDARDAVLVLQFVSGSITSF